MKKDKSNTFRNYTNKKPKFFKCVSPRIYSNLVDVIEYGGWDIIGQTVINYKLDEDWCVCSDWFSKYTKDIIGRNIDYDINLLYRDGGLRPYIKSISLKQEEFEKYNFFLKTEQRKLKIKELLNEKY